MKKEEAVKNSVLRAFRKTSIETYWVLIPILMFVFILMIFERWDILAGSSEMMILVTMLFGESAAKALALKNEDEEKKQAMFLVGLSGFMLTGILWTIIILGNLSVIPNGDVIKENNIFKYSAVFLWVSGFLYSIYVRLKTHQEPSDQGLPT